MLKSKVNILHLEDNFIEAEIIQSTLVNEGLDCNITRVESQEDFVSALEKEEFDIILADYTLPIFDGMSALEIVKEKCPHIPFIFASGTIGEEFAVEAVRRGATDFVLKKRLTKLVPSIKRALNEAEEIKKRKEVEKERLRFMAAIEQTEDYVIICDNDIKILYVNPSFEKITGYNRKEVIGMEFITLLKSGKHNEEFYDEIKDCIRNGKTCKGLIVNMKKDGTLFESEGTITPVRDSSGKIINYVSVRRDVTKERIIQKQIQQAQKMESIGTLAGGIAHDFNNILWGIMGYVELIQMNTSDEQLNHFANSALKACNRAKDLIKQILTFSRQSEQERKPVQVSIIVKEALKFLRASLPSTIEIKQNIKSRRLILGDPTQIHQIMLNLCTNASHAMRKDGGILEVILKDFSLIKEEVKQYPTLREGEYIKLTVSDTGHGMDKLTMERIFEPFFTTKEIGEGTGMGLAMVHGIVKSYEGLITVQSEIDKGTTFEVFFPAIEAEIKGLSSQVKSIPGGVERILLVDDDEELVKMLEENLVRLGYIVSGVTNSVEALTKFCMKPDGFDLIITDQTMPKVTGLELAREFLQIRPSIPIIICTGFAETLTQESVRSVGIKELLMKPVALRDMAEAIRRALGQ
jgi:PAS domain S-box-containing protein